MTAQTARLLVDGNGQIIPNQYYDVVTNSFKASEGGTGISVGGTAVSSSNPLPVAQLDGGVVSGSVSSAAVLFTANMTGYESICVQITSAGISSTIAYETSEDQITWLPCPGITVINIGASVPITTSTTVGNNLFSRRATYFRARVSGYGGGTITVVGSKSKAPVTIAVEARIGGNAPEGAVPASNPIPMGVESRTSSKTSITNGYMMRPISTVDGRQVTRLNSIPENEWQYAAASGGITNTSDVVLQAAAGAGIKNYLTGLSVANASATATEVVVKDGSTVIWRSYVAANLQLKDIPFPTPLQSTANTALNVACITTGTQTYISAQGYKAP